MNKASISSQVGTSKVFVMSISTLVLLGVIVIFGVVLTGKNNSLPVQETTSLKPTVPAEELSENVSDWKGYTSEDIGYSIKYPNSWYAYRYPVLSTQAEAICNAFSDIPNPQEIPSKITPQGHSLINVCFKIGSMPKEILYTNGSTENAAMPFEINGYKGIRGKTTTTLGVGETVFLSSSGKNYVEMEFLLGDPEIFEKMLNTLRFY